MLHLAPFLLIISFCLWYWWFCTVLRGSGKLVNGCLPFVGHTHYIIGNSERLWNVVRTIAKDTTEKGGVARMIIAMQTYYVITDPEESLKASNACLKKHFSYDFAKAWLGNGLITAPTAVWKRHRKLLSPAFTLQILHGFLDIFNAQSRELVEQLTSKVGEERFDISNYFRKTALTTLSRTAFGLIGTKNQDVFMKYANAVDATMDLMVHRFQNAWLHIDLLYKLCGFKKKEQELLKVLNDMSNGVIKEKREAFNNNVSTDNETVKTSHLKYKALLDLLLALSADNTLTDKEIREEVDTAIIAGFDTSSWLLTYICAAIGTYRDVQNKLFDEITAVFGGSDRDVHKEDLAKMVYTEAVIKETLRLYPIIPVSVRTAEADVQLKNHRLRSGDHVFLSIYGINRHPVWGPDADTFRPERWLAPATVPNAFAGFSIGRRSCLGKTYAMVSMKTTLAHVVRRYMFAGDITQLKQKMDFIMKPISGHLVSIKEREVLKPRIKNRMRS